MSSGPRLGPPSRPASRPVSPAPTSRTPKPSPPRKPSGPSLPLPGPQSNRVAPAKAPSPARSPPKPAAASPPKNAPAPAHRGAPNAGEEPAVPVLPDKLAGAIDALIEQTVAASFDRLRADLDSKLAPALAAPDALRAALDSGAARALEDARAAALEALDARMPGLKAELTELWTARAEGAKGEVMRCVKELEGEVQGMWAHVQENVEKMRGLAESTGRAIEECQDGCVRTGEVLVGVRREVDAVKGEADASKRELEGVRAEVAGVGGKLVGLERAVGEASTVAGDAAAKAEEAAVKANEAATRVAEAAGLRADVGRMQREVEALLPLAPRMDSLEASVAAQLESVQQESVKIGLAACEMEAKVQAAAEKAAERDEALRAEVDAVFAKATAERDEALRVTADRFEAQVASITSAFQADLSGIAGEMRGLGGTLIEMHSKLGERDAMQQAFDAEMGRVREAQEKQRKELSGMLNARFAEAERRAAGAVEARIAEEAARGAKRLELMDERLNAVDGFSKTLLQHAKDLVGEASKKLRADTEARMASLGSSLDALIQSTVALTERQDGHQAVILKLREFVDKDRGEARTRMLELAADQDVLRTEQARARDALDERLADLEKSVALSVRNRMQSEISAIAAKVERALSMQQESPSKGEPSPTSPQQLEATVGKLQGQIADVVARVNADLAKHTADLEDLRRFEEDSKTVVESLRRENASLVEEVVAVKSSAFAKLAELQEARALSPVPAAGAKDSEIQELVASLVESKMQWIAEQNTASVARTLELVNRKLEDLEAARGPAETEVQDSMRRMQERIDALQIDLEMAMAAGAAAAAAQPCLDSPATGSVRSRRRPASVESLQLGSSIAETPMASVEARLSEMESLVRHWADRVSDIDAARNKSAEMEHKATTLTGDFRKLEADVFSIREETLRAADAAADEQERRFHDLVKFHRDQMANQARLYQETLRTIADRLGLAPAATLEGSLSMHPSAQRDKRASSSTAGSASPEARSVFSDSDGSMADGPTIVRPAMIVAADAQLFGRSADYRTDGLLHSQQVPAGTSDKVGDSNKGKSNSLRGFFIHKSNSLKR
ncbi:hypothetical protein DFJ74DRAFT_709759 [Hyaloraphidium curvatum]|nr:hypothetical protein DFJ74DRAFT_709759 [Hyaloraphidium curvatum]